MNLPVGALANRVRFCVLLAAAASPLLAQDAASPPSIDDLQKSIATVQKNADIVWTIVAAILVFLMQAGFAMLEAGFTRAKNAGNIMMKNLVDFCMGGFAYWLAGFGLMFGLSNGTIGSSNFLVDFDNTSADGQWGFTLWFFQMVFAATAATIVSGAMAERTKFSAYVIYSFVVSLFIYPVFGHWAWGSLLVPANAGSGSWLAGMGFIDFAGSTVVHSVGGWAALAGAILVGPRIGKYGRNGRANPIPGHSLTLASLGVFILFFGWFGFNPGSTTAADGSMARIAVNTLLAGCMGGNAAMFVSWFRFGKPDIGTTLNGVLAGLVAVTASCATTTPLGAILIGAIAGVVVFLSVLFFDRIKVDDPVGAISVHGVCGLLGTILAALLHEKVFTGAPYDMTRQLTIQLIGAGTAFAWTFTTAFILFKVIDMTIGLRVSEEEETGGLDLFEHGASAYPDFVPSFGSMHGVTGDKPKP